MAAAVAAVDAASDASQRADTRAQEGEARRGTGVFGGRWTDTPADARIRARAAELAARRAADEDEAAGAAEYDDEDGAAGAGGAEYDDEDGAAGAGGADYDMTINELKVYMDRRFDKLEALLRAL
jgi:hypothetical protein